MIRPAISTLLVSICVLALTGPSAVAAELTVARSPLEVAMRTDWRAELRFRIVDALMSHPLDENLFTECVVPHLPQPAAEKDLAQDIMSAWDELLTNNPIHQHLHEAQPADAETKEPTLVEQTAQAARSATAFLYQNVPALAPEVPLETEVERVVSKEFDGSVFPLDPYGYDEYNDYFEPEVYDWFVFITDDLQVVYVHENSDVAPLPAALEDPLQRADQLAETPEKVEVPEGFKRAVREMARAIAAGEVSVQHVGQQVVERAQSISQPLWQHYVRHNQMFGPHRVAELRALLRL